MSASLWICLVASFLFVGSGFGAPRWRKQDDKGKWQCWKGLQRSEEAKEGCALIFVPDSKVTVNYLGKCIEKLEAAKIPECTRFQAALSALMKDVKDMEQCIEKLKEKSDLAETCSPVIENAKNATGLRTVNHTEMIKCSDAVKNADIAECKKLVAMGENEKKILTVLGKCLASFEKITEVNEVCKPVVDIWKDNIFITQSEKKVRKCANLIEKEKLVHCEMVVNSENWARIEVTAFSICWAENVKRENLEGKCDDEYKTWRFGSDEEWKALLKSNENQCVKMMKGAHFKECAKQQRTLVLKAKRFLHQ